MLTAL
jgi:AP-1 complex subunit gamma-1